MTLNRRKTDLDTKLAAKSENITLTSHLPGAFTVSTNCRLKSVSLSITHTIDIEDLTLNFRIYLNRYEGNATDMFEKVVWLSFSILGKDLVKPVHKMEQFVPDEVAPIPVRVNDRIVLIVSATKVCDATPMERECKFAVHSQLRFVN